MKELSEDEQKFVDEWMEYGGIVVVDEDGRIGVELEIDESQTIPDEVGEIVYFIHAVGTDRVKIGYTTDFASRFARLSTSSPYPLKLMAVFPGTRWHESEMHRQFSESRVHGEWFLFEQEGLDELPRSFGDYQNYKIAIARSLHGRFITVEGV